MKNIKEIVRVTIAFASLFCAIGAIGTVEVDENCNLLTQLIIIIISWIAFMVSTKGDWY